MGHSEKIQQISFDWKCEEVWILRSRNKKLEDKTCVAAEGARVFIGRRRKIDFYIWSWIERCTGWYPSAFGQFFHSKPFFNSFCGSKPPTWCWTLDCNFNCWFFPDFWSPFWFSHKRSNKLATFNGPWRINFHISFKFIHESKNKMAIKSGGK